MLTFSTFFFILKLKQFLDAETAEEVNKETPQTKSEPPKVEQSATVESTQVSSTDVSSGKVLATPAIRHYAKTNNIDLSTVAVSIVFNK